MAKSPFSSMYPEMEPGRCGKCDEPALRYKDGIPEEQRHLRETDWKHAGGDGNCPYVRSAYYFSAREVKGAFIPEPGMNVIQFEIRYFDMSPGNTYRHASGIAGYMTLSDEDAAKINADNSTDPGERRIKHAMVFRMVNGQPEPKALYFGNPANTQKLKVDGEIKYVRAASFIEAARMYRAAHPEAVVITDTLGGTA
ncbi:hypothetical protein [Streptomyces brevispora]|uniref:hypothetical protein n=1 Tax=Streptomyces brevispora TaxID=887462 RepID=UPI003816C5BB